MFKASILLALAGSLTACSDTHSELLFTPTTPALSLKAVESLTLDPDGTGVTPVTFARGRFEGTLRAGLIGLPPGLSATLALTAEDVGELRITTEGPVGLGTWPTQIVGEIVDPASGEVVARGAQALAVKVVSRPLAEVVGRVLDGLGMPVTGATVAIADETVTTDETGAFAFARPVATPYDLAVEEAPGRFHVYQGLTRDRPVVHLVSLVQPAAVEAGVVRVSAEGARFQRLACGVTGDAVWGGGVAAAIPAYWPRGASTDATVWALGWDVDPSGQPMKFKGFGRSELSGLAAGRELDVTVPLAAVETGWVAGKVNLADRHTLTDRVLWLQLGERTAVPLAASQAADADFTWTVPVVTAPLGIEVRASSAEGTILRHIPGLGSGAYVAIDLPETPALLGPRAAATIGRDATFHFSAEPESIRVIAFGSGTVSIAVYTTTNTVMLPEIAALEASLPAGAGVWAVSSIGPGYDSLDAFADTDGGLPLVGLGREVTLGLTNPSAFTLD